MAEIGTESTRLGRWIHLVLLSGVIVSGVVLVAGLSLLLGGHQSRPEGPPPAVGQLLSRAAHADGVATVYVGLLLLSLTPVARVFALAVGWTVSRDYRFAAVAASVLAMLVLSLALGIG